MLREAEHHLSPSYNVMTGHSQTMSLPQMPTLQICDLLGIANIVGARFRIFGPQVAFMVLISRLM